jgi:predicted ATP-grasp superfamily ATP-dependent carboligase
MQTRGKILVTDGRSLAALAIARSFGEKGFEVHCGEEFSLNVTSFSKYVKKTWIYPSPESQPESFIEEIKNITAKEKFDMIIPVRDAATLLIAKHADDLSEITNVFSAEYDLIETLQDKGKTIRLAERYGIPHPKTFFPEDGGIKNVAATFKTPFLIRARISSGSRGIAYVRSLSEFEQQYESIKKAFGEPIIQEYVQKQSYCTACVLLDHNSREVAAFTYERVKEYPISGGPTVVGISCDNPQVKAYALQLLQSLKWKGVAEVEFIIDKDGIPKLLEVNPRYWMPLKLALRSGVDFPYLQYQLATGKKIDKVLEYQLGVKYRWMLPNEILWLFQTKNKAQGLLDLLQFREKDTCHATYNKEDLKPLFGIFAQGLYFLAHSEKRKFMFKRGW